MNLEGYFAGVVRCNGNLEGASTLLLNKAATALNELVPDASCVVKVFSSGDRDGQTCARYLSKMLNCGETDVTPAWIFGLSDRINLNGQLKFVLEQMDSKKLIVVVSNADAVVALARCLAGALGVRFENFEPKSGNGVFISARGSKVSVFP